MKKAIMFAAVAAFIINCHVQGFGKNNETVCNFENIEKSFTGGVDKVYGMEKISGDGPELAPDFTVASAGRSFYSYGSEYGRNYLKTNMGQEYTDCYDAILRQCTAFANNYTDISGRELTYSNGDKETVYYLPMLKGDNYRFALTPDQLNDVVITFRGDHPEFYWLHNTYNYSSTQSGDSLTVYMRVSEEFSSGAVRNELDEIINSNISKYVSAAEEYRSLGEYMILKKIEDDISEAVEYGYDNSEVNGEIVSIPSRSREAHTIVGVFDDDDSTMPVCEGYSKAANIILNAVGVDNVYVTGISVDNNVAEEHAWNLVKLDDGRYYCADITWDDGNNRYYCLAKGNKRFGSDHYADTPDKTYGSFQYGLPEMPDTDFDTMFLISRVLKQENAVSHSGTWGGNITWELYDSGLLMLSGAGEMHQGYFDQNTKTVDAPWNEFADDIYFIKVNDGITSVNYGSLWYCHKAICVSLPDSLTNIGNYAFWSDFSINAIRIPESIKTIRQNAFTREDLGNLSYIYYGGDEGKWGSVSKVGSNIPEDIIMYYNWNSDQQPTPTPIATPMPSDAPTPIPTPRPTSHADEGYEYSFIELVLKDSGGTVIGTEEIDGEANLHVELEANVNREQNDVLVMAMYSTDGVLLGTAINQLQSAEQYTTYLIDYELKADKGVIGSIKLFMWNSLTETKPLAIMKSI